MRISELHGRAYLDESSPLPLDRPFTAAQARAEGVGRHVLSWLVEHAFVRQPIKGAYLASQAGDSTWLRCQCLALVVPDDCVIVDRHAAWLLGAPMALAPNEHVELRPISVFRPSGRGRLRNDLAVSGERNLRPRDVVEVHGMAVTSPLRTAWDLGRNRFPEPAIAGLDAMLRLGVDKQELLDGINRFRGMRWVRTLRAVAPLADGRAESPGESVLRLRWIQAGLPRPTPQVELYRDGRLVARLDLANAELRIAAEYDGAEWHSSPEQQAHDRARREDVSDLGWMVRAFVADNVFGRRQDAEQVLRRLAADARRQRRAPTVIL